MNRPSGAPMPDSIRHHLRAKQDPARAVDCPHCGALPHRPCTTPSKRRILAEPHPQRRSNWAQSVACCPQCQVTPTTPCHEDGRARTTVHARRYQEAETTAA